MLATPTRVATGVAVVNISEGQARNFLCVPLFPLWLALTGNSTTSLAEVAAAAGAAGSDRPPEAELVAGPDSVPVVAAA